MGVTRVVADAAVRVADVGGWTDTWFGGPGRVCHLAVGPGVRVVAELVDRDAGVDPVRLSAPDLPAGPPGRSWREQHPLLAHAVDEALEGSPLPVGSGVDLTVGSAVPAGASLGTSASVLVALLGALDALVGNDRSATELAEAAHRVETQRAGREAGVQDQWAAALGGCGLLAIDPYPRVDHHAVGLAPAVRHELDERVVTVVVGAHDSSAVHREVIAAITADASATAPARRALRAMAVLAQDAADALASGDVDGWADILRRSTDAQAGLHGGLVGPGHRRAMDLARAHGALGWKVNGAGGAGGSLTAVVADGASAAALAAAWSAGDPAWTVVPLTPAGGLAVRAVG